MDSTWKRRYLPRADLCLFKDSLVDTLAFLTLLQHLEIHVDEEILRAIAPRYEVVDHFGQVTLDRNGVVVSDPRRVATRSRQSKQRIRDCEVSFLKWTI